MEAPNVCMNVCMHACIRCLAALQNRKKEKKGVSVLFLISFSLFLTISDGSSN